MARKKIVFVIVEGPSDDEALSILLAKVFKDEQLYVHITHGDITSTPGVTSTNILSKVGNMISQYAKSTHLVKSHFKQIIHIIDMDGAFIPPECIVNDSLAVDPVYSLEEIRTNNVEGIRNRNIVKANNIEKLSKTSQVWGVPYQAYYMSCNLDHVLYNKINSTDDEKEADSLQFARRYKDDIPAFVRFIKNSDFSVNGTYLESWSFIKENNKNSLERHTNLGICFPGKFEENCNNENTEQTV